MHDNSLEAYREETDALGARANAVYEWLKANGPATDRQVMVGLGFRDPNTVRPRITELIDSGLAIEVGSVRDHISNKTVRRVDVRRAPEQLALVDA